MKKCSLLCILAVFFCAVSMAVAVAAPFDTTVPKQSMHSTDGTEQTVAKPSVATPKPDGSPATNANAPNMNASALKQMQQQMQKLDEVETNFVNIAGINQTANTLQAFAGAYASGTRADVATVDEVLDLQDAIQEQQHAFQEIDTVLAQTWMPVDDRPPPPSGPGTSQERALEQELQGYIDEADPSPKLHQLDPQQETPALEMPSPPDSLISTPTTPTSRQETESSQPPVLSFV